MGRGLTRKPATSHLTYPWWCRASRPVCTTQTAGHYPLVWTIQTSRCEVCINIERYRLSVARDLRYVLPKRYEHYKGYRPLHSNIKPYSTGCCIDHRTYI
ncbi:hypothetical protein PsYK624_034670 [Phanerochaete sordida]|uniref:Uncharacterized protein n=1 Tax=Phanerochaete sordida TaxID=48140 RepID=A0A9P3LAC1_9APHY|nr:hypothetical protein PsYK624_034670 [Phanerochaete sordida]